MRKNEKIKK